WMAGGLTEAAELFRILELLGQILLVRIDRHLRDTIRADPGAEHTIGVERHRHAAVGSEGDGTAVATEFRDVLVDDLFGGVGEWLLEQADAHADRMCSDRAQIEFTPAGA